MLSKIGYPLLVIYGKDSSIVKPSHVKSFVDACRGDQPPCTTIHSAQIGEKSSIVVIALNGGQELFQENKKCISTLIEQLLVGYHEVTVDPTCLIDIDRIETSFGGNPVAIMQKCSFEDHFIDCEMKDRGIHASTNVAPDETVASSVDQQK